MEGKLKRIKRIKFILTMVLIFFLGVYGFSIFSFFKSSNLTILEDTNKPTPEGIKEAGAIDLGDTKIYYDEIFGDDTTGDGTYDRRSYYLEDELVLASWDTDGDKIQDQWFLFTTESYVDRELYDTNNDGSVDKIYFLNEKEEVTLKLEDEEIKGQSKSIVVYIILPAIPIIIILLLLFWQNRRYIKSKQILTIFMAIFLFVNDTTSVFAENIVNEDGTINQGVFEREWRNYSDFRDVISWEAKSKQVKNYYEIEEQIETLEFELFMLEGEAELDRYIRQDVRDYKNDLVEGDVEQVSSSYWQLLYKVADLTKSSFVDIGKVYDDIVYNYIEAPLEIVTDPVKQFTTAYAVLEREYAETVEEWNQIAEKSEKDIQGFEKDYLEMWENTKRIVKDTASTLEKAGEDVINIIPDTIRDIQKVIKASQYFANDPSAAYEYAKAEIEKALKDTYVAVGESSEENLNFLQESIINVTSILLTTSDSIYEHELKSLAEFTGLSPIIDEIRNNSFINNDILNKLKNAADQAKPSAQMSEAELLVLRTVHIEGRVLDNVLMETSKDNSQRRSELEELKEELEVLYEELLDWETKEKERVRAMLLDAWQKEQEQQEESSEDTILTEESAENPNQELWTGQITFIEVYEGSSWTKEQRDAMTGQTMAVEYYVTKVSDTELSFYNSTNGETFIVNVQGEQLDSYEEAPIPDPNEPDIVYQKMNGSFENNGSTINALLEVGSNKKGPMFLQSVELSKITR